MRIAPPENRPQYDVTMVVEPTTGVVTGRTAVVFTPDLDTDRLVFRLWANSPRPAEAGTELTVDAVAVAGAVVDVTPAQPTLLEIPVDISAGESIEAEIEWTLVVRGSISGRVSRDGGALRLGSVSPLLSWEPGVGWATDPPTSAFAEAVSSPVADYELTVSVPDGFDVMASGVALGDGRFRARLARDIAVSVGRFTVATGSVDAGRPVTLTVGVHDGLNVSPESFYEVVEAALADLADRYGPYPYPTYSLAITPGLGGGIEFPMHVFQGPATLGRTTPHEVAHMWFYGLIGNNQGRDPYLDEGLATWAEVRHLGEESPLGRDVPEGTEGQVGQPMTYWETRQGSYYRAVYVQGADALRSLGDAEMVGCALRLFVARNAWRIATPADLVEVLELVFPDDAASVTESYGLLRQP